MIAVIGALEGEIESIREHMSINTLEEWNNRKIQQGMLSGNEVVLTFSGVGKVNAAGCVQHIIDTYRVDAVFFIGIAGALNDSLKIGDIVLADECVQWDVDLSAFGYLPGELLLADERRVKLFYGDENILRKALSWKTTGRHVVKGRVLTGDTFLTAMMLKRRKDVAELFDNLRGVAVEMEGAAAAQVCFEHAIPFFLARVISDTPAAGTVKRFKRFLSLSSQTLYSLIDYILSENMHEELK